MTLSTFYLAFCLFVCNGNLYPFSNNVKLNNKSSSSSNATVEFLLDYLSIKYPDVNFEEIIYVGIKRQELYYIKKGQLVKSYHISSSADGAGNVFGSNKTPIGLHKIQKKIGEEVPIGGIFEGKKFIGKIANINKDNHLHSKKDEIVTRILTLQGQEEGINKGNKNIDSYHRRIYIHGTPEEHLIGQPASHGCIRMTSEDVIELFDFVPLGVNVIILNN
ncbi:MAG: L,D-transpeptidase [Crocinitomicaceae bacterium]|jgi:hypothetical protein|nr:L,D-transpeptidase [Crocinitomicaceae bacterium]MBT6029291.1 L,D-transpeptidase [Crocinitomicaceae bacterium]